MKILSKLAPLTFFAPFLALAQDPDLRYFGNFGEEIIGLIQGILVPLVFAIAFLMFLWGMFQTFILGGGDEDKQEKGKQLMVYAVIGFVVMTAIWGIVALVTNVFGVGGVEGINIPLPPGANPN